MNYRICLCAVVGGLVACVACLVGQAQPPSAPREFNGLNSGMNNLHRLSNAESRSISAENFKRRKGQGRAWPSKASTRSAARELGRGWKVSPCVRIKAKSTFTVADIDGSGAIQQIWFTPSPDQQNPAVHPAILLGRRNRAVGRSVRWATSSPAAGASIARSIRCQSASIPAAPSTATGRCRSARKRRSRWKISTTRT